VLRALFAHQAAPLYGQAERFELDPLPGSVATDYVAELFDASDRDPGAALPSLIQTAAGHPQRLNLLAHHLWNRVADGETADDVDWVSALDATLTYAEPEILTVWTGLSANQRRALRLAAGGEPFFGAAATRLHLVGGPAQAARRGLEERSVVDA
jgi:hypothetical protein